ncbi:hypothetical protein L3Q82_009698 [Scortum barcoo]|uniref:Uncharacterized protein n=1 Tax=Scortum barcoo TaxID=214431 RepID=A0ACB8WDR2_9TELE|nr:hypothetical protein L3Q82_009698 [Scortum barcoo]
MHTRLVEFVLVALLVLLHFLSPCPETSLERSHGSIVLQQGSAVSLLQERWRCYLRSDPMFPHERAEEEETGDAAPGQSSAAPGGDGTARLKPVLPSIIMGNAACCHPHTVKKWSEEAEEALKDCFNTTLWDVFSDAHGEDIDSLTHCLTDYINFCVENTVPTRTVRSFSNSKPWITPDIKALLKEKRRAFVSGNKEELKSVQRELRRMIRKGKDCYRRKMEHQLQQNNICGVWKGLKTISGFKEPKSQPVGDQGWANDLNLFFNRFDQASAPPPAQSPLLQPPSLLLCPLFHGSSCAPSPLSRPSVHTYLTLPFHTLSCAPPPINTSLLQPAPHITPDQLCGIFGYTFNLSLKLGRVPQALEDVLHRPSAKDTAPQGAQQLQAGSSDVSSDEDAGETGPPRPSLPHPRPLVSSFMDPLQFAYQPDIGVDDAVIYLLHTSLTHLEKAGSTVRIMFFDFSSAFNTIQPRLLGDKLQLAGVDHHLTTWILDYLTHRPQFVRVQGFESDRLLCSTGAPQGTVLAPFLFTLYTADFSYNTPSCHLQKFSDDSAVVGLITDGDDREYRGLIQDFADWCLRNNLQPPDQRW